jgi:hypothetical protein
MLVFGLVLAAHFDPAAVGQACIVLVLLTAHREL